VWDYLEALIVLVTAEGADDNCSRSGVEMEGIIEAFLGLTAYDFLEVCLSWSAVVIWWMILTYPPRTYMEGPREDGEVPGR
jgi:hypothetical protein